MKKKSKLLLLMVLCLTLVIGICSAAYAIDPFDTDEQMSLDVAFQPDGLKAHDVEFRLYKVADIDEFASVTAIDEDFAGYDIDLSKPDSGTYRSLEALLPGYIAADGISPDYTAVTDSEGVAHFEDIPMGLYFVMGDQYNENRMLYTPYDTLVCVPNRLEDESWDYDVEIEVKYEGRVDSEPVDVEVLKVWNDSESKDRPKSITVELYDGSELFDTVVLGSDNNWRYKWKDLYGGTKYTVKEKDVPSDYKVSMDVQGTRFVITNTKEAPPDNPPVIPKTGMLWWPVPILAVLGLGIFAFGWSRNNRSGEK